MLILGYAGNNTVLRKEHVLCNRTCRESTAREKGIKYLEDLLFKNLSDLFQIIQWNAKHQIKFYRIPSDFAPHLTNPNLIQEDKNDYTKFVYSLEPFRKYFKKIGDFAKKNKMRLTFHPDLFNVLNSPDEKIIIKTFRDLYFHTLVLNMMNLDTNSVIILHGGGIYRNKNDSMNRWVLNFNKLSPEIKERIVLENDETGFSVEDVLKMSNSVEPFLINLNGAKIFSKVPIVFDIFHYYCYSLNLEKISGNIKNKGSLQVSHQKSIAELLPLVKETWDRSHRQMKMHISEQLPGGMSGAHNEFVETIPEELINFAKKENIYLMVEAKSKEQALLHLREKYYSE